MSARFLRRGCIAASPHELMTQASLFSPCPGSGVLPASPDWAWTMIARGIGKRREHRIDYVLLLLVMNVVLGMPLAAKLGFNSRLHW